MEKGYPPQESAPPYPGPPLNYGPPQPQAFPQPGGYPQPSPYPPPPGGYQSGDPYPPPATTTVTHVIVSSSLRDAPGQAVCQHCHQNVITKTAYVDGLLTWLSCVGLGVFGCFLCCCVPFCIDPCKDVEHRCPNCNQLIFLYKRLN